MSRNAPSDPAPGEPGPAVLHAAATVLGVAAALGERPPGMELEEIVQAAAQRGYLTPDEEEALRVRYKQYFASRAALVAVLDAMERVVGRDHAGWAARRPAFVVALAAALLILRQTREWTALARQCRPLRKSLDLADARHGLPRKTFIRAWRAGTEPGRLALLERALRFHRSQPAPDCEPPEWRALLELIEREADALPVAARRWRERADYRWFSFRRRHHSAWKQTVFGLFRGSGSLIADLRQPWIKPVGAPKRIGPAERETALAMARPGDVFITRHEDALSNLFLPGFWPHAALYLGDGSQRAQLGYELPAVPACSDIASPCFLEARKDGVRFRVAEDTLAVDAFVILRPPLAADELAEALRRAARHAGKLYDFVFDFRHGERLACTEVVYRAFHGCGPLSFKLIETGGRLCLPAEELIDQSLTQGFEVVACAGLGHGGLLGGSRAELALHASRCGM